MTAFNTIMNGNQQYLSRILNSASANGNDTSEQSLANIGTKLNMNPEQIALALGFNKNLKTMNLSNHANYENLIKKRNAIFVNDVYDKIVLKNILAVYNLIKDQEEALQIMQYLLLKRVTKIESTIEKTLDSLVIEKYKIEMRVVYADNIADIEFAEQRLSNHESGFRTLLNEVCMIAESRLIPIGDIFFRNTVLPQEKRKLLNKKLIPLELIKSRLEDQGISQQEQKVLSDFLRLNSKDNQQHT